MRLAFWNIVLFAVHLEITLLYPEMEMFLFVQDCYKLSLDI